jgi:hypothetical protein
MQDNMLLDIIGGKVDLAEIAPQTLDHMLAQGEAMLKREAVKEATQIVNDLAPMATDEQFAVIRDAARTEAQVPAGYKVGWDFNLSEAQQNELEAVKLERIAELVLAKEEIVTAILQDENEQLEGMKVRVSKSGVTTKSLVFKNRSKAKKKTKRVDALNAVIDKIKQARQG